MVDWDTFISRSPLLTLKVSRPKMLLSTTKPLKGSTYTTTMPTNADNSLFADNLFFCEAVSRKSQTLSFCSALMLAESKYIFRTGVLGDVCPSGILANSPSASSYVNHSRLAYQATWFRTHFYTNPSEDRQSLHAKVPQGLSCSRRCVRQWLRTESPKEHLWTKASRMGMEQALFVQAHI